MVNSNQIIFASVSLDTNTNGTESHTYPANKSNVQYKQEQHCVYNNEDQSLKLRNSNNSLNNIT